MRSIGSDLRMDYTAVGQTTHLAARMEQLARPGTIAHDRGHPARWPRATSQVKPLGPTPVKGLAEPVEVYELVGAGAARTRLQAVAAAGSPASSGATRRWSSSARRSSRRARGHGQVVAVVGEPGVGKSRLFYEFIHSHRTQGWLVLEAGSVSYGKATPLSSASSICSKGYFKIDDRDDDTARSAPR